MTNHNEPELIASPSVSGAHHEHQYFEHLKRRLRWQLLFVYLTPLLVLSVYFHFEYSATLREGINNHLISAAENQRNTVDLFLQERVANLRCALGLDPGTFPPEQGFMERVLAELQQESGTFVDVGLFDPEGTLVAYTGPHPKLIGKDYHNESWYRRLLLDRRGQVISDVYLGFRDKPHFIVAVSREVEGQTWVLRASVDPEKFGEFVGSSYLLKDAEAFIVNQDGVRQTLAGEVDAEFVASQVPPRSPRTVVSELQVQGQRYVRALAWLAENDWALVVRVPTDQAYASMTHARRVLVAIMLAAMGFLLFVVFRSTRKIVGKLASVGEMAAGVAHEINNPLAIIYEEASMLEDILDPQFGQEFRLEDFRERLIAIKEATLRGRTITGKLMAFARRHDSDPEPSDINLLLNRVLAVKDTEFKTSNIEVVRDHAEGLPQVMINRNQLDQVILNLLNNAKDAIDQDGRITTRTRLEGKRVHIEVEDTGGGMPPEVIERIFFPFFTTKGVGKGTGLGLSISYGIIESHGGRIQVRSKVGKGTTFIIWLPIEGMGGIHVSDTGG